MTQRCQPAILLISSLCDEYPATVLYLYLSGCSGLELNLNVGISSNKINNTQFVRDAVEFLYCFQNSSWNKIFTYCESYACLHRNSGICLKNLTKIFKTSTAILEFNAENVNPQNLLLIMLTGLLVYAHFWKPDGLFL